MLSITLEPHHETYLLLLQAALKLSSNFSLVWPDQLRFNQSAQDMEKQLAPFLEKEVRSDVWPGTKLFGQYATVRFYRYAVESCSVLRMVSGLYEWRAPNLPEDLAFYKPNGQCWLGSIAHETDAFLELNEDELAFLYENVPDLVKS
jgi:hypothetical protein